MLRSFKLKMALFSLCTSGVILLAFAALFMSSIRRAGLERVDHHLQAIVEGQQRHPMQAEYWVHFDDSLTSIYGEDTRRRFLMQVTGPNGAAIYASPHWPATLTGANLFPSDLGDFRDMPEPLLPPRPNAGPSDEPPPDMGMADGRNGRLGARPNEEPRPDPDMIGGHNGRANLRPPGKEPPHRMRLTAPHFMTVRAAGQDWRFIAMRNPNVTLLLGTDMAELQAELARLKIAYATALPLGLLFLASGGWLLARQALRPVQILTRVAGSITAKGLDQRVQAGDADQEFRSLIDVINGMLNRLEVSFRQSARFSADAAHELKTPLTILQGQLNQALRSAPADSDEQRTYADLLDEVQRLKAIVRKLLLLAQSDSGQLRLSLQQVCVNRELEALFEDLPLLAPGLKLNQNLSPDINVMADADLLRQVLQNLISNAVKYNHEHGTLSCALRQEAGLAILSVSNTITPGMKIEKERLFDRFYRGDAAHNRKVDGTGLGLSLAREISRAHGGDLTVEEAREGWISFRLSLPLTPPGGLSAAAQTHDGLAQDSLPG